MARISFLTSVAVVDKFTTDCALIESGSKERVSIRKAETDSDGKSLIKSCKPFSIKLPIMVGDTTQQITISLSLRQLYKLIINSQSVFTDFPKEASDFIEPNTDEEDYQIANFIYRYMNSKYSYLLQLCLNKKLSAKGTFDPDDESRFCECLLLNDIEKPTAKVALPKFLMPATPSADAPSTDNVGTF